MALGVKWHRMDYSRKGNGGRCHIESKGFHAAERTSRILSTFHFFLYCEEVEYNTLMKAFSVSKKTAHRDICLLERAGVLEARFDRERRAFVTEKCGELVMAAENNQTRLRYLHKIRRICLWMIALEDWEESVDHLIALYQRLFPEEKTRTRQRDFEELRKLGYFLGYSAGDEDTPGGWYAEIPPAFCLKTIPTDVNWW